MDLINIWHTGNNDWDSWDSGKGRALGFATKQDFYDGVGGPFCYIAHTVDPANAPQGFMQQVWGALHWQFVTA